MSETLCLKYCPHSVCHTNSPCIFKRKDWLFSLTDWYFCLLLPTTSGLFQKCSKKSCPPPVPFSKIFSIQNNIPTLNKFILKFTNLASFPMNTKTLNFEGNNFFKICLTEVNWFRISGKGDSYVRGTNLADFQLS